MSLPLWVPASFLERENEELIFFPQKYHAVYVQVPMVQVFSCSKCLHYGLYCFPSSMIVLVFILGFVFVFLNPHNFSSSNSQLVTSQRGFPWPIAKIAYAPSSTNSNHFNTAHITATNCHVCWQEGLEPWLAWGPSGPGLAPTWVSQAQWRAGSLFTHHGFSFCSSSSPLLHLLLAFYHNTLLLFPGVCTPGHTSVLLPRSFPQWDFLS